MNIGIDIRNIGKKRTGDEAVFFNLTKNLALIDSVNNYKLFTDITDEKIISQIKNNLGITRLVGGPASGNNFEIISLKTANKFSWNFWTLAKYLRKNPADIYLTQYITPWFVPRKIKIATIIHDISFNFYPQFIKFSDLFFLKKLIPMSLKRADKIIAVSQFTKEEIIKYYNPLIGGDPEKIAVVHNAVADDFLEQAQNITEEKIKTVKEKYKLPEKYILYIGTLQPRKNIPALVEGFALLKSELSSVKRSVKLVIAGGKGHNYDRLIDEIIEKNNLSENIIFPGYIDEEDKAAVMAGAEIFCFPSLYEGFGIPILEAMSAGVPVVASDIAPHREIAGEAALFFNPQIAGELSRKLREILQNNVFKNGLIDKGREQTKKFSWKKSAEKMLEVFQKIPIDNNSN